MHFQCHLHFDSKLYLCNMSFLPFPFLWLLLISSRIKGFRWVSLISFPPPSIVCLPGPQQHKFCTSAKFVGKGEFAIPELIWHQKGANPQRAQIKDEAHSDQRLPTIYCMCISLLHTKASSLVDTALTVLNVMVLQDCRGVAGDPPLTLTYTQSTLKNFISMVSMKKKAVLL